MGTKFDKVLGKMREDDSTAPHSLPATSITYDNSTSGLTAADVQAAIDEVASNSGTNFANILYVDPNGDDATGEVGNNAKPYLTLEAARDAASSGQSIHVMPGTYTVTTTDVNGLSKDGVDYYFNEGAIVNKATSGSMFNNQGFSTGCNVYGEGEFNGSVSCGYLYYNLVPSLDWIFNGKIATSTNSVCIYDSNSTTQKAIIVFTEKIRSTASDAVFYYGDFLYLNCPLIESTAASGIVRRTGLFSTIISERITSNAAAYGLNGDIGPGSMNVIAGFIDRIQLSGGYQTMNVNYTYVLYTSSAHLFFSGQADSVTHAQGTAEIHSLTNLTASANTGSLRAIVKNAGGSLTFSSANRCQYYLTPDKTGLIYNASPKTFTISGAGARVYLVGDWAWYRLTFNVSNGELHIMDHFETAAINGAWTTFNVSGGKMFVHGTIKEDTTTVDDVETINYSGGEIILADSATFIVRDQEQQMILASTGVEDVKIKCNAHTNKTGFNSARQEKFEFYVVNDSVVTSVTINGELFTPTVDTAANMAAEIISDINLSGTVGVTASAGGAGNRIIIEADTAGSPIAISYGGNTGLWQYFRRNNYGFNYILGGTMTESASVTE